MNIMIRGVIVRGRSFVDENGEYYTGEETFAQELQALSGDIVVGIDSGGGDFYAGGLMYTALRAYDRGKTTALVTSFAASAATLPMVGAGRVLISPMAMIMIHNPASIAAGDYREMENKKQMLVESRDIMAQSYVQKTGKTMDEILRMMDAETMMNAKSALDHGFVDQILFENESVAADVRTRVMRCVKSAMDHNDNISHMRPVEHVHCIPKHAHGVQFLSQFQDTDQQKREEILKACADIMNGL